MRIPSFSCRILKRKAEMTWKEPSQWKKIALKCCIWNVNAYYKGYISFFQMKMHVQPNAYTCHKNNQSFLWWYPCHCQSTKLWTGQPQGQATRTLTWKRMSSQHWSLPEPSLSSSEKHPKPRTERHRGSLFQCQHELVLCGFQQGRIPAGLRTTTWKTGSRGKERMKRAGML